jgi:hypothetical protein
MAPSWEFTTMQASMKNAPLSPAASDLGLGLGNQLQSQVDAELNERKKKLLSKAGLSPAVNPIGPAAQSIFNMMGGGTNGAI